MGILSRLFGGSQPAEQKSVMFDPAWWSLYGTTKSKAGTQVDWSRALDVSTVFACIRVIAEGVAQVPLCIMKESADGKSREIARDHPLFKVLNSKPNAWQTSFSLRETMIFHLALTGNAYFFKNMVRGKVVELIPIDPASISLRRHDDYSIEYTITNIDGSVVTLPQSMVWHVRGPSWDSWRGLDAVRRAREAIGLTIATENTQAELHANGLQTSGVFTTDQKIAGDDYKKLQQWIAAQIGGNNRHKPFILDSNLKWAPQSMTGVDAQHLETRKFQIEEVCRAFRVLPPMIGHSGQAMTFASAEQVFLAHVIHTLGPWWERIRQSIDADLLDGDEDAGYCAHFDANELMKGAHKDRAEFYAKALGTGGAPGYMTQNEIRSREGLNPVEGGDELPVATNIGGPTPPESSQAGGVQEQQNDIRAPTV